MLSLLLMCSSITPAILTWERHRIPAYSTSNAIMSYGFNNTPALPWIHGDSWLCVCICAQTCHKLVNHNICWDIICIFLFFSSESIFICCLRLLIWSVTKVHQCDDRENACMQIHMHYTYGPMTLFFLCVFWPNLLHYSKIHKKI